MPTDDGTSTSETARTERRVRVLEVTLDRLPEPRARLTSPLPVIRANCRQSVPEDWVRTIPAPGVIPLRNLNSSLSVESTRVVFSPMMDL